MLLSPRFWSILIALLFALAISACGESANHDQEDSPDGPSESAFVGGKADQLFGNCHLEHLLLQLNDPSTDADTLIDAGVHSRAARNIAAFRAGDDGLLGTDDDRYFQRIEDVDAVYFVGPVAIQQLIATITDYCDDQPFRQADTIFSPRPSHDSHITRVVELIEGAERSIDMAMYSLSDNRIYTALGAAVDRGVQVRLLFESANGDHLRTAGSRSARLEDLGVDVRYINRIMHHKFAIIDGPQDHLLQASQARFFSGSGNLSFGAATRYDENTTFHHHDPVLILHFQREFNHLWAHSRDLVWNEALSFFETLPIQAEMIPLRDELPAIFTSANFETTYSSRWGSGFRPIDFSQVAADELVAQIENARSSIFVAAGFLRSRPIAEALLRRWEESPDLDIRIYLDQSEYISQWFHNSQTRDLESCLVDSGDDPHDVYGCRERGFIFSYQLLDAEIPVRFKNYSYRWHFSYALQMHHKYMIFDGSTVATGSYNFSNNAEQNTMENIVFYHQHFYPGVVAGFVENFETIWETGRAEGLFDALLEEISTADEIDLIFEPAALTWEEVTAVRTLIRQRCPDVDSEPYRTAPQDHRTCTAAP